MGSLLRLHRKQDGRYAAWGDRLSIQTRCRQQISPRSPLSNVTPGHIFEQKIAWVQFYVGGGYNTFATICFFTFRFWAGYLIHTESNMNLWMYMLSCAHFIFPATDTSLRLFRGTYRDWHLTIAISILCCDAGRASRSKPCVQSLTQTLWLFPTWHAYKFSCAVFTRD